MKIDLFIPILRQVLQIAGGALIARGYLDETSAEAIYGILINALALGWWLFDRCRINRRIAGRVAREASHG